MLTTRARNIGCYKTHHAWFEGGTKSENIPVELIQESYSFGSNRGRLVVSQSTMP